MIAEIITAGWVVFWAFFLIGLLRRVQRPKGEAKVSTACSCEHESHFDGSEHGFLEVRPGGNLATFVGALCVDCTTRHLRRYVVSGSEWRHLDGVPCHSGPAQIGGPTRDALCSAHGRIVVEREDEGCQWWASCCEPATTTRRHPLLGDVPICDRCDAKESMLERASA